MNTTISIPFEEDEDSPIEGGDRDSGFRFSRVFLTNYADRFLFLTEMFTGGLAGAPKSYHDDFPHLRCFSFNVERVENRPTGPSTLTDPEQQIIEHDTLARITIEYAPIEPNGETYLTYSQSQSVEFIDVVPRGMVWESSGDPLPADVKPVVPILNTRHEITWHQVQNPPWGLISNLKGFVNSQPMEVPTTGMVLGPGTVLFSESSSRQTMRYDGAGTTELTLVFLEKRQNVLSNGSFGWNHKFNAATGQYDRPVSRNGQPLFQEADLLAIFA